MAAWRVLIEHFTERDGKNENHRFWEEEDRALRWILL